MERDFANASSIARADAAWQSRRYLLLVMFGAGIGTLGVEMVASHLLALYFGTSQLL